MKYLYVTIRVVVTALILLSCTANRPSSAPAQEAASLEEIKFNLFSVRENTYPVAVQFLVDNSNSVESECGGVGKSRYDFLNYLLDIFRTIPESVSNASLQNFHVGVSTFGNSFGEYISVVNPADSFRLDFPTLSNSGDLGGTQSFSRAIQGAIDELYSVSVEKRYLIVVTDGKFSSEDPSEVSEVMKKIGDDDNFYAYISLFCSDHKGSWGEVNDVDVFDSLAKSAIKLLGDLRAFLPLNSVLLSPESNQEIINVNGYYNSSSFLFWSADSQQKLKIVSKAAKNFWYVASGDKEEVNNPPEKCKPHTFTLNSLPPSNWLLFVKHKTFTEFDVSMSSFPDGEINVVNNTPIDLHFEIASPDGADLGEWEDCFSAQTSWVADLSNGVVPDQKSCPDIQHLCLSSADKKLYAGTVWKPQFSTIGKVVLRFKLNALNENDEGDPVSWMGETIPFEIKFKPKYDEDNSSEIAWDGALAEKVFAFEDVATPDLINLYLVSEIDLDGNSCPYPTYTSGNIKTYRIELSRPCDLDDAETVGVACASRTSSTALTHLYTFRFTHNVISNCQYSKLYFDWPSGKSQKETTWECDDIRSGKPCKEVAKPDFLP